MPRIIPREFVPNAMLDAALRYINEGFEIMPVWPARNKVCTCHKAEQCTQASKHPIARRQAGRWTWHRVTSKDVAKAVWGVHNPPNIAITTGPVSGIFVLDVDAGLGKVGYESLQQLIAQIGELPDTRQVVTGSGGRHYFFRWPDYQDVNNSNRNLPPDLDIRGRGGYVVAAPSETIKGAYEEVDEGLVGIVDAPSGLLKLLKPPERQQTLSPSGGEYNASPARLDFYAQTIIDAEVGKLKALQGASRGWIMGTFSACCNLFEIANSTWNTFTLREIEKLIQQNLPVATNGEPWDAWEHVEGARNRVGNRQRDLPRDL